MRSRKTSMHRLMALVEEEYQSGQTRPADDFVWEGHQMGGGVLVAEMVARVTSPVSMTIGPGTAYDSQGYDGYFEFPGGENNPMVAYRVGSIDSEEQDAQVIPTASYGSPGVALVAAQYILAQWLARPRISTLATDVATVYRVDGVWMTAQGVSLGADPVEALGYDPGGRD